MGLYARLGSRAEGIGSRLAEIFEGPGATDLRARDPLRAADLTYWQAIAGHTTPGPECFMDSPNGKE